MGDGVQGLADVVEFDVDSLGDEGFAHFEVRDGGGGEDVEGAGDVEELEGYEEDAELDGGHCGILDGWGERLADGRCAMSEIHVEMEI